MRNALAFTMTLLVLTFGSPAIGREWTDSTGVFKVQAELIDVSGDVVHLRKTDGSVVAVPIDRLSVADQKFVRDQASARGKQEPAGGDPVERIRTALASPTRLEFIDTPIDHVFAFLQEQHRIPIVIDRRAWDDVGLSSEVPVTRSIKGVTLGEALDVILKDLELTWLIRDEVLLVTTPEEAESQLEVIVYRLKKPLNFNDLIQDITRNLEPNCWASVGGPGDLAPLPPQVLVVSQTQAVQRKIRQHYTDLIQAIRPAKPAAIPTREGKRLADALEGKVSLEFIETPLKDAASYLSTKTGLSITLDQRALEDVGLGADCPVTINLAGIRLRSALSLLLRPLDLTWVPAGNAIRITTPEGEEAELELVSYPVNDLTGGGDMTPLVALVQKTIAPQTWDRVGGPGSVRAGIRGTLDVRQTFHVQELVCQFLADLREARK